MADAYTSAWVPPNASAAAAAAAATPVTAPPAPTSVPYVPEATVAAAMLASSGGSGGSGAGGASAAAAATSRHRAWYHNAALHYAIALVAVFVTSLILLVLIQPPFVQAQPEDKLRAKQFHGGRAAVAAAIATAFAGVIMLIVFGVTRRKGRK